MNRSVADGPRSKLKVVLALPKELDLFALPVYYHIQLNYFNTELYSNLHHWQVDGKVATRYKDWKKPDIDQTPQDMLQSLIYFLSIILFIATIILNQGVWLTKIVQASSFLEFSTNP